MSNPVEFKASIKKAIQQRGLWHGDIKLKEKHGNIRIYDCLVSEFINSQGNKDGYINLYLDQTDKIQAEKQARTDSLTNLANRYHLDECIQNEVTRAIRYSQPLTIMLIDIDYFKQVNDQFGHLTGDAVLKLVANALQNSSREVDLVGRWGGEEFVVLCPEITDEQAIIMANKLRQVIESLNVDSIPNVTISCGVTQYRSAESIEHFIGRADTALYQAKERGRNRAINL